MRTEDTSYLRGWVWRTKYSACGGIGAGLGEGNEGVECGRYGACLNASEVERETECDVDESTAAAIDASCSDAHVKDWTGNSYTTVEMVGIGGKVKRKLKERVRVGGAVKEYEDERTSGAFLKREKAGDNRAWCSWCERVVPGKKDNKHIITGERQGLPSTRGELGHGLQFILR